MTQPDGLNEQDQRSMENPAAIAQAREAFSNAIANGQRDQSRVTQLNFDFTALGVAIVGATAGLLNTLIAKDMVGVADMPATIKTICSAFYSGILDDEADLDPQSQAKTAEEILQSISPEYLTSFLDGKKYKMLKRHILTHGLTVDEYRERFGLGDSYPMVAANYSLKRSALAKETGLGTASNKAGEPKARQAAA